MRVSRGAGVARSRTRAPMRAFCAPAWRRCMPAAPDRHALGGATGLLTFCQASPSAWALTDSARFARLAEPAKSTETQSSVPRAVDPHRPRAIAVYLVRAAK
eukprot:11500704-Alexandrium_andersonii.AAC.1